MERRMDQLLKLLPKHVLFLFFVQCPIPRKAVGEMMPVLLATRIAVPDQWETFLVKLSGLKYLQAQ
jgi:hypothetical protein